MKFVFLLFTVCGSFLLAAQTGKVNWMNIEQAMRLYEKVKKPIFVDVYTDWCGYCKKMERETFQDSAVASYLNANFYPVKLDAESDAPIHFKDSVFNNDYKGKLDSRGKVMKKGLHSFAIMLLQGKMSYPTVVYFLPDEKIAAPVPGYKTPEKIQPYLLYFGEGIYKMNQFEAFSKGMRIKPLVE